MDDLKPTSRTEVIEGVKCSAYDWSFRDSTKRYWLDPLNQFIVRRVESQREGRSNRRISISYRNDPAAGLVPNSWRTEDIDSDGSPQFVRECEVLRFEVNAIIDPSEFRLVFKPGTHVHDQKTKRQSLVLDDGSTREFTVAELNPAPPQKTFRQWVTRHAWTLVLIGSVLFFCLLPIVLRRRSRPVAAQPG